MWPCLYFFLAQFDIPYSILFVQVTSSHFSKFKIIVGMSLPCFFFFFWTKQNKKSFNSKVASHNMLCPSFVCRLSVSYILHECEDITKNAWRTPLNAQCNIEYRLEYSLFFSFLNYHRNRLFLYFLVNYRTSIISSVFWVSIPNPDLNQI